MGFSHTDREVCSVRGFGEESCVIFSGKKVAGNVAAGHEKLLFCLLVSNNCLQPGIHHSLYFLTTKSAHIHGIIIMSHRNIDVIRMKFTNVMYLWFLQKPIMPKFSSGGWASKMWDSNDARQPRLTMSVIQNAWTVTWNPQSRPISTESQS